VEKLKLLCLSGLVVVVALYSCSKGDTGAAGPKGPAGPDSVYHSNWINANLAGALDQNGDSVYFQDVPAPNITQGILDSGLIISYISTLDQSGQFTDVEPLNGLPLYEDYLFGDIEYTTIPANQGGFGLTLNGSAAVRYVVIPGSVLASTDAFKGMSKAQIKTMSYSKVTSILGNSGVIIKNN